MNHPRKCWLALAVCLFSSPWSGFAQAEEAQTCFPPLPRRESHKSVYTVGVLAHRGVDAAYEEFNETFCNYLSETAGKRFDPPIKFDMKPLDYLETFWDSDAGRVDFIYVNPSLFSCIESEYEAQSLVSQVSSRTVGGVTYYLKRFGGVIAVLRNNTAIHTIHDLKDKIIAASSVSGLGSGQMQFRAMQEAGMSWVNDPRQLVFTSNQDTVVDGLLSGEFDVAFVRTDQIQTHTVNEQPVDQTVFRVIDPKPNLAIDGVPFPFQASTQLYAEWNLAALKHVPDDISREVQGALLALADHAKHAPSPNSSSSSTVPMRCDTTDQIAEIAVKAMADGKYSQWTPTLSYMELRSMQEATGFIVKDKGTNSWKCIRPSTLYDSITCPPGYLKKSATEVDTGCAEEGLLCKEGYQCICSPCYLPFECRDSVEVWGSCVSYKVLLVSILVPIGIMSFCVSLGVYCYKSHQLICQARAAARNERQINEFIAHEVRNPLSAAMSACTFVTPIINGGSPITNQDRKSIQEDVQVIDRSLHFISDLLRSMLDIHLATSDNLLLGKESVSIRYDLFEPVISMIYNRDCNFQILWECPDGLVIEADRLRLQQVVLNLTRNSAKFLEEGFIKLKAEVVDNSVQISVEDSGPGIPLDKRGNLFDRFQNIRLDKARQGTGVGLFLSFKLIDKMGGDLYLDEEYDSGVEGGPGARFVIDLNRPPATPQDSKPSDDTAEVSCNDSIQDLEAPKTIEIPDSIADQIELPEKMSVLFVDDDLILRKQSTRAIARLKPDWTVRQAASGESALQILETESFDMIFMDQ